MDWLRTMYIGVFRALTSWMPVAYRPALPAASTEYVVSSSACETVWHAYQSVCDACCDL